MNESFRRKVFNECFDNGRIGTIKFIKKSTGKERQMNCRIRTVKREDRKANRKSSPNVVTVWDIPNSSYKSIRLDSIKSISARKETINFGS